MTTRSASLADPRIRQILDSLGEMRGSLSPAPRPPSGRDSIDDLVEEVSSFARLCEQRYDQIQRLVEVTARINAGMVLEEVLNHVFDSFHTLIPYDRIGLSLIDPDGETVRAIWARSTATEIRLPGGYTAPLAGSSLRQIMETGQPRILNDLEAYLREHPASESTRLIVTEGFRASLTCPLVAMGQPIGFIFFSSTRAGAYTAEHVSLILQVAGQLALTIEKSRLYERMVELNSQKNTLLGIAAHDLRGPIAVIQGFVELVQEGVAGPITPKQEEVMALIRRACNTMLGLINNFLDISAIEAGKLQLEPREVDLRRFLEESVSQNGMLASAKAIRIELELPSELPRAHFDPERINQVLNNLIGNAIKFSHRGTAITVGGRKVDAELEIFVQDRGQGIPAGEVPELFRSFGRGSVRPTAGERSTGLGLAIVRRMVEAHGGRVTVESQVGEGSRFNVRLPLVSEPAPARQPLAAPGPPR
jgi:signal transduction histidine kinase